MRRQPSIHQPPGTLHTSDRYSLPGLKATKTYLSPQLDDAGQRWTGQPFLDQAGAGVVFGTIQRSNMWGGAGRKNTFEIFDRQKINKIKNNKIFHILNRKAWAV